MKEDKLHISQTRDLIIDLLSTIALDFRIVLALIRFVCLGGAYSSLYKRLTLNSSRIKILVEILN